ncbi:MAG: DNA ligase-associated DEXH box helicase [Meiothermus sp.]
MARGRSKEVDGVSVLDAPGSGNEILTPVRDWFSRQGWKPFPFQEEVWQRYLAGESGLMQVVTGAGKTYAATMGPIAEMLSQPAPGLKLLYVTPLRAVSRDIEKAITTPVAEMGWNLRVESRIGDTAQKTRRQQLKNMPDILITTPESLELMLAYPGSGELFKNLRCVVADEWHELLGNKRGVLLELSLARLRQARPELRTWALTATVANPQEAAQAAVGTNRKAAVVSADLERRTVISSVLPERLDTFPWAGQLAMSMAPALLKGLDISRSTLIFTNTRRQAERWYQALTLLAPQYDERIALHHGSLSRAERERVEAGVKEGSLKWVVATSSLDLGVDFQPVERVVQIGSPKGVARLLQRAGRAAHQPGGVSEVVFVPTQALEILEIAAARQALREGAVEPRRSPRKPYDVLAQHLVTLACGDGFYPDEVLPEVRTAQAYRDLSDEEFGWVLEFVTTGRSLQAYPEYRKVIEQDGLYKIASKAIAGRHRQGIGTITSEGSVLVKYTNRQELGTLSESFVSRLKKGDVFAFSGRQLELVMVRDMTAYVKNTTRKATTVPSWLGARFAISGSLGRYLRHQLSKPEGATPEELEAIGPLLDEMRRLSKLPSEDELLVEEVRTREGRHLFVYPFEGSHVHEGLAALLAYRMASLEPGSFALTVNDYGLEILGRKDYPFERVFPQALSADGDVEAEIRAALNLSELAKRQFREIAQIAGLIYPGRPGARKTTWQLQGSASTLYGVFRQYEPDSLLLKQAEREVLEEGLEGERLRRTLGRMQSQKLIYTYPKRPTPLGFPLLVDRLSTKLSNEDLLRRILRMKEDWVKR